MFFLKDCKPLLYWLWNTFNRCQSLLVILSLIRAFSKASLEGKYAGKVGKYVQLHIIFFSVLIQRETSDQSKRSSWVSQSLHTYTSPFNQKYLHMERTKNFPNYCTGKKFDNNLTAPSGNFPSWSSLPWLVPLSPSLSEIKRKNMNIHLFLSFAFIVTFSFSPTGLTMNTLSVKVWLDFHFLPDSFDGKCHIFPFFLQFWKPLELIIGEMSCEEAPLWVCAFLPGGQLW